MLVIYGEFIFTLLWMAITERKVNFIQIFSFHNFRYVVGMTSALSHTPAGENDETPRSTCT